MTEIRNILLIGRTGSGKSALANVISGTKEFRESGYSVSGTKKVQTQEFEYLGEKIEKTFNSKKCFYCSKKIDTAGLDNKNKTEVDEKVKECCLQHLKICSLCPVEEKVVVEDKLNNQGIKYRIIDTVGVGDTKMSLDKVLYNLTKVGYVVKDGLSQIWFVTGGKLEEQEKSTYNLLKETIFDEDIANYTTIIRTRFTNFEDESKCAEDRQIISKDSGEFREVIKKDGNRIIHVDNPSVGFVIGEKEKDINDSIKRMISNNYKELEKVDKVALKQLDKSFEKKELSAEAREISREILLNHLTTYQKIYKPASLDNFNKIINKEWRDKEILKEKITKEFIQYIKEKDSNLRKEVKEELKKMGSEIEKKLVQLEKGELDRTVVEKEEASRDKFDWKFREKVESEQEDLEEIIGSSKTGLERKIEELEKRIIELEKEAKSPQKQLKKLLKEVEEKLNNYPKRVLDDLKENEEKLFSNPDDESLKIIKVYLLDKLLEKGLDEKTLDKICEKVREVKQLELATAHQIETLPKQK